MMQSSMDTSSALNKLTAVSTLFLPLNLVCVCVCVYVCANLPAVSTLFLPLNLVRCVCVCANASSVCLRPCNMLSVSRQFSALFLFPSCIS